MYLQDRGATDQAFYEKYLPNAKSYFEVLDNKAATYHLFEKLESAFNGNLCPVLPGEIDLVTDEHLQIIKRCFWSDLSLANQPMLFDWRIFDFDYIPIQVISEIYEDFLRKEVGAEQMDKTGAFYTPHALAEFILNQVLPYPSSNNDNYNIRTLDPTCGSGIFLVDSLNRLLDRWEYAHPHQKLTFETIKQIVLDNIFGIEIEPEAIKVSAFSIYLAMLDRLDPKTLWQNNQFPYLIYDETKSQHLRGRNLFRMSSLNKIPVENPKFDLVVGNPPFGAKDLAPDVKDYFKNLKKQNRNYDFGKETVIAFLHRVTELCPTGKIALISTSKILFNNGSGYQRFRQFLFQESYVEKVYNFSALRRVSQQLGGRNLFASATRPVCVLFYSKQQPTNSSDQVIYYTPTTAIKNRLIDGIAIDPTDVKYLPRAECQNPNSKIWKAAMWGTERDFELIKKLSVSKNISTWIKNKGLNKNSGVGYENSQPLTKYDPEIRKMPHLSADNITRYTSLKSQTVEIHDDYFRRLGSKIAYNHPHMLIKEGQEKKRFCASFIDFDCSFKKTVFGIHSVSEVDSLKLLTAYLNSSLATYIMFLKAADWGVERERVKPNELFNLPDLCFTLPTETQGQIVTKVDEIITLKKIIGAIKKENSPFLKQRIADVEKKVSDVENQIEAAFRKGLNLSATDQILIDDFLDYRLDAFQEKQKSNAFLSIEIEHSQSYATHLCQTINHFLQPEDGIQARAEYFEIHRSTPLQVIILHLDEQKRQNMVEQLPVSKIDGVLRKLEKYTYKEEAESIYFRRFLRYYDDDTIYIVKPNERRFWSRSIALNDADEIILEILTSEV